MAADARVRYTKMIIEKSFIELLKVKPLNKITVKEVCDLSEINRSTFYKHYEDVFDLFDKIKDSFREEFLYLIKEMKSRDRKKALVEALEKIKKNKDIYITLISEQSSGRLLNETFNEYYYEMIKESTYAFSEVPKEKQTWVVYYLAWGSSGILHYWVNNDMKQSTQEVADLIENLVENTIKFASGMK